MQTICHKEEVAGKWDEELALKDSIEAHTFYTYEMRTMWGRSASNFLSFLIFVLESFKM